jgi:hypothetical protein
MLAKAMQQHILDAIQHYTEQEIAISNSPTARNYLVRMMMRDGFAPGLSKPLLARALTSLIGEGRIKPNSELGWKKPDRHPATGLVVVGEVKNDA